MRSASLFHLRLLPARGSTPVRCVTRGILERLLCHLYLLTSFQVRPPQHSEEAHLGPYWRERCELLPDSRTFLLITSDSFRMHALSASLQCRVKPQSSHEEMYPEATAAPALRAAAELLADRGPRWRTHRPCVFALAASPHRPPYHWRCEHLSPSTSPAATTASGRADEFPP